MDYGTFIWTEAFNCPEILDPMVRSFFHHHKNHYLNIFLSKSDREVFKFNHPRLRIHVLNRGLWAKLTLKSENYILKGFEKGHLGTARLWAYIFRGIRAQQYIHLDADQVFVGEVIADVESKLHEDFMLVGTRRPYLHRSYRKEGKDGRQLDLLPDVMNTDLLGIKRNGIKRKHSPLLVRRIRGARILRHPIIDFFDPIMFEIIRRGSKVYYLDSPSSGKQSSQNKNSRFFTSRISFAAVGSGVNFSKNPEAKTSSSYINFALASWSLYSLYLLDRKLSIEPLKDLELISRLERLDKKNWILLESSAKP